MERISKGKSAGNWMTNERGHQTWNGSHVSVSSDFIQSETQNHISSVSPYMSMRGYGKTVA